jgi:hypothetical protein
LFRIEREIVLENGQKEHEIAASGAPYISHFLLNYIIMFLLDTIKYIPAK